MKKVSIFVSLFFMALSVGVFFVARTFPGTTAGAMGPGFFPMIIAVIVFFLSALLLFDLRKQEATPLGLTSKTIATVFLSLVITAAYVAMIRILGFPLATFLYLIGIMKFFGAKGFVIPLVISTCVTGLIHGVFTVLLFVQMPRGIIF